MSQIVLGKVAFVDKGVYATASTYNTFDFVVTDDSCYLCVKDGNKNHPLTDTAWWKCIARGTQATEAARTALAEANKALEATRNALSAAGLANANAREAKRQADLAGQASDDALAAAVDAEAMISEGKAQIASMRAAEQSLMSQALLAPHEDGVGIRQEDNVGEYGRPEDCRESVPGLCPSERDLSASVLFRGCPVCGPTWELDRP